MIISCQIIVSNEQYTILLTKWPAERLSKIKVSTTFIITEEGGESLVFALLTMVTRNVSSRQLSTNSLVISVKFGVLSIKRHYVRWQQRIQQSQF